MIRAQMVLITILMPAMLAAQQWIDVTGKGNLFRRRETMDHADTTTVFSGFYYNPTTALISTNTSNVSAKKRTFSVGTADSSYMVVTRVRNSSTYTMVKKLNAKYKPKPKTKPPPEPRADSGWISWSGIFTLDTIPHRSGDHGDEGYRTVSFLGIDTLEMHKHYKTKKKK